MIIDPRYDVDYSPDDGGWYGTAFPSGRTTAIYATEREAIDAVLAGRWDDPEGAA